jgi:phosphatidylglycerophosphatase A
MISMTGVLTIFIVASTILVAFIIYKKLKPMIINKNNNDDVTLELDINCDMVCKLQSIAKENNING